MVDFTDTHVRKLADQEKIKLLEERTFWDEAVLCGEPENETEALRAVRIADYLLEARRERFNAIQ